MLNPGDYCARAPGHVIVTSLAQVDPFQLITVRVYKKRGRRLQSNVSMARTSVSASVRLRNVQMAYNALCSSPSSYSVVLVTVATQPSRCNEGAFLC